ncbi:MAG: hypothetical protein H7Z43_12550 [Clostridia bacterium]|nr:hypothetical protein [Deltaproteobacteria bacterium]
MKTCDAATNCPGGYSCQGGICVSGSTGVPEISSIAGTSDLSCGDNGQCIGTAFVVSGNHLTNTTFNMADTQGRTYDMTVQGDASDTVVTLVPVLARRQTDLFADTYTLTAVNASGSATSGVQLLQGEPGPDLTADELIDRINTASATKKILASRLEGAGGTGTAGVTGTLHNVTGTGDTTSNIFAIDVLKATVNGTTTGAAASITINGDTIDSLCGDDDGCELTLGATNFYGQGSDALENYEISAQLNGGTCRFFVDTATHKWTLSQDCVAIYGLFRYDAAQTGANKYVYDRAYQRYEYSSTFGQKNSGASNAAAYTCENGSPNAPGDGDGAPLIVLGFKGACYFAEGQADNTKNNGCFQADSNKDYALIASGPSWDYTGAYPHSDSAASCTGAGMDPPCPWHPDDGNRKCVLIAKD